MLIFDLFFGNVVGDFCLRRRIISGISERRMPESALSPSSSFSSSSNLGRFLHSITPNPPAFFLPKSYVDYRNNLCQPTDKDNIEYFCLGDLWKCYEEWSAYGVGTQVLMGCGESITQYYAPYLSGIQIYTDKCIPALRSWREDSDAVEVESDSWSDDSVTDKLSRSPSNNSSKTWDAVSEDSYVDQDGSLSMKDKLGYLYLQYFERSSPYFRVPLVNKITEIARSHPGLLTLRSLDLSPASWLAVAWYPIYHIPSQRNNKDLAACFLTYHTLSMSFQDMEVEYDESLQEETCYSEGKLKGRSRSTISLSPFGLATYKMQGNLWVDPDTFEHERIINLYSAADSWLKQLNVHHPDFNFFSLHS